MSDKRDKPRRDWTLLPPEARPVVGALSIGIVALMIWDKVAVPREPEPLHSPHAARVYGSDDAPVPQLDLSHGGTDARSLEIAGVAPTPSRPGDRIAYLHDDGQTGDSSQDAAKPSAAALRGHAARETGRPILSTTSAEPQLTDRTRPAMTEEERSALNERMFRQLEAQKKRMGIKVLDKGEAGPEGVGFLGLREPPVAPALHAPVPTLLASPKPQGTAAAAPAAAVSGLGRPAPDAALVFTDARSVSSSWVLLGLPGDPPATDFTTGRLVIIKPSATKILSVTPGPDAVTVVYRSLLPDEESDPARDRAAPLPLEPKAVLIYDASPR